MREIPEALYDRIAANPAQWAQWHDLGMRDSDAPGNAGDLKAQPYLMVDTALFDAAFRADLLKAIPDLDASTDGLLVHGDNFQALTLLRDRYREQVNCIYIDPPYNSPSSEIAYKNSFKHSSWLTLMSNRIDCSAGLQSENGGLVVAIDKYEQNGLERILNERFGDRVITSIPVEHNRKGVQGDGFSYTNEYAIFVTSRAKGAVNRYSLPEVEWEYANLRNWGGESDRTDGKTCFYPIFVNGSKICGFGDVPDDDFHPEAANIKQADGSIAIWPIDASGDEKKWRYARDTVEGILSLLKVETARNGNLQIMKAKADAPYKTMWYATKYNAGDHGTKILTNMGFKPGQFDFPKSIHTVSDCVAAVSSENALVLDYFAGSGTTAHSVIKLNRESGGGRRYALVEQGPYFDTVIKPRVQKVVYSSDWRDGKPTAPNTGISHAFKVLKIESYEDALNNLTLKRDAGQQGLLERMGPGACDDYLMRYMLDVESRGSLLSVEDFAKPFDYELDIAVDSAGATQRTKVDLLETFNYLIGLTVKTIDIQLGRGFATVEGTLPDGKRTLILWRDCEKLDYEGLAKLCERLAINPGDTEYDVVYVNGDHNLPTKLQASEADGGGEKELNIRQIEPEFLSRMFDVADA
jgi:adenine-specific DNA-methyltransferase